MKVQQIMTRDVKACGPGDSLQAAARLMWEHDCGCVPVIDARGAVVGMLTDRDICMATSTQSRAPQELRVDAAMSADIACCHPQDSLSRVEALMQERQVHRLPVVERDGRLVGILSLQDLTRAAAADGHSLALRADDVVHTLAAICRPRRVAAAPAPKPVALLAGS